jgi:hypothetical protein
MSFVFFVVFMLISLWLGLVVHEAGHLAAAFLVKLPVRLFIVGQGPVLLRFRWWAVPFEFRLFPTKGAVMYYRPLLNRKYALMLFAASGVLFNIAFLLLFTKSGVDDALSSVAPSAAGGIFLGLALPLMVLAPQKSKLYGQTASSDGLHLIELLKSRNGAITPTGDFFLKALKKYSGNVGRASLNSSTASEVLDLLHRLTTGTKKEDVEASGAKLIKLATDGGLPPLEEVLILDYLIGYAAMSNDDALLPKAQEFLSRALAIAPDAPTLNLSRGIVLASSGRYREAKDVLLPFTGGTCDKGDRLEAYLFLARSEKHLGNGDAAARWLLEGRRVMDTVTVSSFFKQCFLDLEAEILEEKKSTEIP